MRVRHCSKKLELELSWRDAPLPQLSYFSLKRLSKCLCLSLKYTYQYKDPNCSLRADIQQMDIYTHNHCLSHGIWLHSLYHMHEHQ